MLYLVWLVIAGWFKVYTAAVGLLMSVAFPKPFFARFFLVGWMIVCGTWLGVEMWGSVGQDWEVRREPLTDFLDASQGDDRSAAPLARAPKDWTILMRVWFGVVVPKELSLAVSLLAAVGMAGWVYRSSRGVGPLRGEASLPPLPVGGRSVRAGGANREGGLQ